MHNLDNVPLMCEKCCLFNLVAGIVPVPNSLTVSCSQFLEEFKQMEIEYNFVAYNFIPFRHAVK